MRPDFMDEVCKDCIRQVEENANRINLETVPQCSRCNFLVIIKIEPFHDGIINSLFPKIKQVLDAFLSSANCARMQEGLYLETEVSDNDLREARIFRFATAISNVLNLSKSDKEFLVLQIHCNGSCKHKDLPHYEDFATSVSPLKVGALADFLKDTLSKRDLVGCIKIESARIGTCGQCL